MECVVCHSKRVPRCKAVTCPECNQTTCVDCATQIETALLCPCADECKNVILPCPHCRHEFEFGYERSAVSKKQFARIARRTIEAVGFELTSALVAEMDAHNATKAALEAAKAELHEAP